MRGSASSTARGGGREMRERGGEVGQAPRERAGARAREKEGRGGGSRGAGGEFLGGEGRGKSMDQWGGAAASESILLCFR